MSPLHHSIALRTSAKSNVRQLVLLREGNKVSDGPKLFLSDLFCLQVDLKIVGTLSPVPEIIDPVFAKTSPKRSFSMTDYEDFGLVFHENVGLVIRALVQLTCAVHPPYAPNSSCVTRKFVLKKCAKKQIGQIF